MFIFSVDTLSPTSLSCNFLHFSELAFPSFEGYTVCLDIESSSIEINGSTGYDDSPNLTMYKVMMV